MFKGEVFNAFINVIQNFYSCETNVEFTLVCFDLEASLVLYECRDATVGKKYFKRRWKKGNKIS